MGQEAIRQIGCYAQNTRVLANQNFTTTPLAHPVGFGRDTHKHLQQYLVVGGSKVSEFHGFGKSALQQNSVKYSSRSTTILVRASESRNLEIRVCSNKACRKSGSIQTLDVIKSLAPANVSVESCGCLGKCGNGPNLVILPAELMVSHCSTAAHAARLLAVQCGAVNPENNLAALALKEQANKAFEHGNVQQAEELYTQAIEMNPSGGLHFIYANRSAARLAKGDLAGAVEDAKQAAVIAPQWAGALVRQAEALTAVKNYPDALAAYQAASRLDASIRRSRPFQHKVRELQAKLIADPRT